MSSEKFIQNRTALITLIAACIVVLISLGVRQTFGLFFMDFKNDLDISITQSGLAIGIQMLMWGLTGPIFGAIADKHGGHKAVALAFLFYIAGIYFLYTGTNKGIFFVTRLKSNAKHRIICRRPVLKVKGLTCDQTIEFSGAQTVKKCPIQLRRIGYKDPETGKHYVFLSNNFHLSAKTIADIYKARWQVELFFKWIKQNLKIKSFVGTSKNAVMTQIWIALCVYLLLAFLKFQSKLHKSMQQILRLLQLNLFDKRELMALLRGDPPDDKSPDINQMALL